MKTSGANVTRSRRGYPALAVALLVSLMFVPSGFSQELAEPFASTEVPIDAPVIPEPPTITPEPEPTATLPAPLNETPMIDAPIIPAPIESPDPASTEEPTINSSQESTPEAPLEPTDEPASVTWSMQAPLSCELRDGDSAGLGFEQSQTYSCEAALEISSESALPEDLQILWHLGIDFPDTYQLQLSNESLAAVESQQTVSATAMSYTISQEWSGTSLQSLAFEIVVTRNSCGDVDQLLSVKASPEIRSLAGESEITRSTSDQAPTTVDISISPEPQDGNNPVCEVEPSVPRIPAVDDPRTQENFPFP